MIHQQFAGASGYTAMIDKLATLCGRILSARLGRIRRCSNLTPISERRRRADSSTPLYEVFPLESRQLLSDTTFVQPVILGTPTRDYAHQLDPPDGERHTSVDIDTTSTNAPPFDALAVATGDVVRVIPRTEFRNDNHGMGNVVIVDHQWLPDGGPYSYYAHLRDDSFYVSEGTGVGPGTPLAQMGFTGYVGTQMPTVDDEHVHLELKAFPVLGNVGDDTAEWGYTPGHPNLFGYMNPTPYLENTITVLSPTVVTVNGAQEVLDGPGSGYSAIGIDVGNADTLFGFAQFGEWYQVFLPSDHGPATGWVRGAQLQCRFGVEISDDDSRYDGIEVHEWASAGSQTVATVWDGQYFATGGNPVTDADGVEWLGIVLPSTVGGGGGWVRTSDLKDVQGFPSSLTHDDGIHFATLISHACTVPEADLAPQNVLFGANSIQAGSPANASFQITNLGNATAPATIAEVRLTPEGQATSLSDPELATNIAVNALAAGASQSFSFPVTIPSSTTSGSYRISVVADNGSILDPGTSGNDFAYSAVFSVVGVSGPAASVVVNDVDEPGGDFHAITVYYTDDVAIDVSDFDTGDVRVTGPNGFSVNPPFITGDDKDGTPRFAFYGFTPPGGSWDIGDDGLYRIEMLSNEVTNTSGVAIPAGQIGSFNVNIAGVDTDLRVSFFDADPESGLEPGDHVDLDYRIENIGTQAAGGFDVEFYLSRDDTISSGDIDLGSRSIAGLAAGVETSELDFDFNLPSASSSFWNGDGNYYVLIEVNGDGSIAESSLSNNTDDDDITVVNTTGASPPEIEIDVYVNGLSVNGAQDIIHLGSVFQGDTGPTRTFRVENSGGQTLLLGSLQIPSGFTLVEGLSSSIAPGSFDNFTVRLDSDSIGTKGGVISVDTNDPHSAHDPFEVSVSGVVLEPGGTSPAVLWSSYIGGIESDWVSDTAVDSAGNIYVSGRTESPGWVSGGFNTQLNGGVDNGEIDGYLVKLDPDGQHLWSTYIGAIVGNDDRAHSVAVDQFDNVIVVGELDTAADWVTGGADTSFDGATDGYVVKIDPNGNVLWASYIGGDRGDDARDVAIDTVGNIYVVGGTNSTGWASGGHDLTHDGESEGYVIKFGPQGDFQWSSYIGGSLDDYINAVAVDPYGNVLIAGDTVSDGWTYGGSDTDRSAQDTFVVKLDGFGNHVWSTYVGGDSSEDVEEIAAGWDGSVYLTGTTWSENWATGGFDTTLTSNRDGFAVRLGPDSDHIWSTYLGGIDIDEGYGVTASPDGMIYLTGRSVQFGSPGPLDWLSQELLVGQFDGSVAYIVALDTEGVHHWSSRLGGNNPDEGLAVASNGDGRLVVVGETSTPGWIAGGYDETYRNGEGFVAMLVAPDFASPLASAAFFAEGSHRLEVQFSEDVNDSLSSEDLLLEYLEDGTTIDPSLIQMTYASSTNTATFTFPGLPGGLLPVGEYRATLAPDQVFDSVGNGLANQLTFEFTQSVEPPVPNTDPNATDDEATTTEDDVLVVAAPGVLLNDDDDQGDSLVVDSYDATSTLGASVTMNADGSFSYDPTGSATLGALNNGDSLNDTFTYTISDGNGGFDTATVTVDVDGITDATSGATLPYFEDFTDSIADDLTGVSGSWTVSAGRYNLASAGGDSVAVLDTASALPAEVEFSALVTAGAAGGGLYSNAGLIFDYQSPTDFKYVLGAYGNNKVLVGQRTGAGWQTQLTINNVTLTAGALREFGVIFDDTGAVEVFIDGGSIGTHNFATDLTDGQVGMATSHSNASYDNVSVQEPDTPPPPTGGAALPYYEDFTDGIADDVTAVSGSWVVSGGRYDLSSQGGDSVAVLETASALPTEVEYSALVTAGAPGGGLYSNAGLIFDYQSATDFKYVLGSYGNNRILVGQRTGAGWQTQLTINNISLSAGALREFGVIFDDTGAVEVFIDGGSIGTHSFATDLTDGQVGLATSNSNATFDNMSVQDTGTPPSGATLPYSEDFGDGTADFVTAVAGAWAASGGRFDLASQGGDSIAVLETLDPLPSEVDFRAMVTAGPGGGGLYSNAGLIFDYQNATDFKYVLGAYPGDAILIGHRTAAGWQTAQSIGGVTLDPGTLREFGVVFDSVGNVEIFIDNVSIGMQNFATDLTDGQVGMATSNSDATYDNVSVQDTGAPPTGATLPYSENFGDGTADFMTTVAGDWNVSGGVYDLTTDGGTDIALLDTSEPLPAAVEFASLVAAGPAAGSVYSNAGLVFDYQSVENFKYVLGAYSSDKVLIGHRLNGDWNHQVTVSSVVLEPNSLRQFKVSFDSTGAVEVFVDDVSIAIHNFASDLTDGQVGLFTSNSNATFDDVSVQSASAPTVAPIATEPNNTFDLEASTAWGFHYGLIKNNEAPTPAPDAKSWDYINELLDFSNRITEPTRVIQLL